MQDVKDQKIKLEQKKNRLLAEEIRLILKERKMRTRNLIELGGLVVKAGLDCLPINILYGALISLNDTLKDNEMIKAVWSTKGNAAFNKEKKEKTPIILKFTQEPVNAKIRQLVRNHGLKWNRLRAEWYGYCPDLESLKQDLGSIKYQIEEL